MALFQKHGNKNLKLSIEDQADLHLSHKNVGINFTKIVINEIGHNYLFFNRVFRVLNISASVQPNFLHRIINRIYTTYFFSNNLLLIPYIFLMKFNYIYQIFKNSIPYETSKIQ